MFICVSVTKEKKKWRKYSEILFCVFVVVEGWNDDDDSNNKKK